MGFAREVANRMVFLETGSIVEEGSPDDLFYRPRFERTREFLWKITELYGKKDEGGRGGSHPTSRGSVTPPNESELTPPSGENA
jgi:ABC-type methionine transport system ATPase subunit